jgi:hypothetical protein
MVTSMCPHEEISFNASFSRLNSEINRFRSEERPPAKRRPLHFAI